MTLSITELRKGTIFKLDGTPYKVLDYAQKVMGRGGSIVNVKIKSLADGKVLKKTFKGNEQLEPADITNRDAQFLYSDSDSSYFMDNDSFEQFEVGNASVGEQRSLLKEGQSIQVQIFEGRVISIIMPKNVYLKVEQTENAVKGDTTSSVTKDAILETGATLKVPAFIKTGDVISVDTATGAYRERKKG